jgi:hypothetical protein
MCHNNGVIDDLGNGEDGSCDHHALWLAVVASERPTDTLSGEKVLENNLTVVAKGMRKRSTIDSAESPSEI